MEIHEKMQTEVFRSMAIEKRYWLEREGMQTIGISIYYWYSNNEYWHMLNVYDYNCENTNNVNAYKTGKAFMFDL